MAALDPSDTGDAQQAIVDAIERLASSEKNAHTFARPIKDLAEAYAWLRFPNQPHGSQNTTQTS